MQSVKVCLSHLQGLTMNLADLSLLPASRWFLDGFYALKMEATFLSKRPTEDQLEPPPESLPRCHCPPVSFTDLQMKQLNSYFSGQNPSIRLCQHGNE
jgi:hypothetical protein